jgi:putative ABC transport system permease protein
MSESDPTRHTGVMQRFRKRITTRSPVLFAMREAVGLGLAAVRAYKLRAGLTILGVVMGVMTVTGMSSIIAGLNNSVASSIQGLGASVVFIRPFEPGKHLSSEERRRRKWLSREEARLIAERCPAVKAVAPMELVQASVIKHGSQKVQDAQVLGTTPNYEIVHESFVEKGRFFSETETRSGAALAVIGVDIADALFPSLDPLGKEIMVDNRRFSVVGVMERKGKFLGHSRDNLLLIPIGSFESRPPDFNYLAVDFIPTSTEKIDDAIEQVREVLRRHRRIRFLQTDTFGIFTQDTFIDLYRRLTGGIYLVMIAISCIGLVVGGVGVMNIMLVSVTERTREIGVRKALGATKRDIRWQFLTEAMTLTGLGGILGVLVGALVAWVVNLLSPFPATLQPLWVLLAFFSSVAVGLTFGLWPAVKAARLDPIEALRYE